MAEKTPYAVDINGTNRRLSAENCSISLFRNNPQVDYLAIHYSHTDGEHVIYCFESYELITWMGGIAIGPERQRLLHLANREEGSFDQQHGWRPAVLVTDQPDAQEQEMFVRYELTGADDLEADFKKAMEG